MRRFVEGMDRGQATLFPECLEDWVDEDNPVRVIDAFVDKLDLSRVGFDGVAHPAVLLKPVHLRLSQSGSVEREAGRNVEVMWLTSRLVPDHKTIADFRKGRGQACPTNYYFFGSAGGFPMMRYRQAGRRPDQRSTARAVRQPR
jgi:transposase